MSINSTDVLNTVSSKTKFWFTWPYAEEQQRSFGAFEVYMQASCKNGNNLSHQWLILSHKYVEWDHNIYDLFQKLFFITCNSADYWYDIRNPAAKVQQNKEKLQTLTELNKIIKTLRFLSSRKNFYNYFASSLVCRLHIVRCTLIPGLNNSFSAQTNTVSRDTDHPVSLDSCHTRSQNKDKVFVRLANSCGVSIDTRFLILLSTLDRNLILW